MCVPDGAESQGRRNQCKKRPHLVAKGKRDHQVAIHQQVSICNRYLPQWLGHEVRSQVLQGRTAAFPYSLPASEIILCCLRLVLCQKIVHRPLESARAFDEGGGGGGEARLAWCSI